MKKNSNWKSEKKITATESYASISRFKIKQIFFLKPELRPVLASLCWKEVRNNKLNFFHQAFILFNFYFSFRGLHDQMEIKSTMLTYANVYGLKNVYSVKLSRKDFKPYENFLSAS